GIRRDGCIGIEIAAARGRSAIEQRDVLRVMDAVQQRIRYRGSRLRCEATVGGDRVQNRRDALWTFGMPLGTVPGMVRVGEQGDHSMVRARKRSICKAARG